MPDHVHLLIYYPAAADVRVSEILTTIKRSVTLRAFAWAKANSASTLARMEDQQPSGKAHLRFWQRGEGYDRNLSTTRHIRSMIDYIHCNPVEAGLCARAIDWPWSSARAFAFGLHEPLSLDLERFPRSA